MNHKLWWKLYTGTENPQKVLKLEGGPSNKNKLGLFIDSCK
jgi:hypothetical protein